MFCKWGFRVVAAVVVSAVGLSGNVASAQCSGGGGGRMPSGSPATLNSAYAYSSNTLTSSPANLAMQYQQRQLLAQSQAYAMAYQTAQQQRLLRQQRNAELQETRLARAEAKRAAKADRIATRLREQTYSSDEIMLTSTSTD
ncbi:hypothetical protein [Aporhodopirellula aestuarii]|uniref:Uncharacterized protein n=1 Tax=Aporhodopirellula aestuarii TaxID=2950107 RepID=A0ABT0TWI3_9BACT|nr:hypothetical protein [Aporhodopirellula aestuarii]MCM2369002.1 hypothetical protein [Aporhodopirellula aestuarii]